MFDRSNVLKMYYLTPLQEGMIFHALYNENKEQYFQQLVFDIDGGLDLEVFEESLRGVVRKYDVLRTVFVYEKIVRNAQVVFKNRDIALIKKDISTLDQMGKEEYISNYLKKDRMQGFDLATGPLLRVSTINCGSNKQKIVFSFHHIIMDGWSMAIVIKDIFENYYLLKDSQEITIDINGGYESYVKWLENSNEEDALKYWAAYLNDYSQKADLPTLNKKRTENAKEHKVYKFNFDKSETEELKTLAKNYNVTLNILIQSIWGLILQRLNNTDDVVYGSVVSGRQVPIDGIEKMVGLLINTIPIRIKTEGVESFKEVTHKLLRESMHAEEYSYLGLNKIQACSELKQDLFSSIIAFENYPMDQLFGEDNRDSRRLSVSNIEMHEQTNYDLNMQVIPDEVIEFKLSYNSDVYSKETIRAIEGYMKKVIKMVSETPDIKLSEIEIITDREKETILFDFNDTKAPYPSDKLIHEMFEEQAARNPEKTALIFEGNTMSYGELDAKANSLAWKLRDKGVKPDDIVGIMVERSFEMVIGIMGILKAGGAYLPIDPEYPKDRTSYILEDSGTGILLTQEKFISQIDFSGEILCLEDEDLYTHSTKIPEKICTSRNLAYVIYTSGSTGKPKGTMIEHHSAINRIHWMQRKYPIKKADVILQKTPFTFDVSVWELFWWAFEGASLCLLIPGGEKDPKAIVEAIDKNNITTMHFVPSMLNAYLEYLEANKEEIPRVESLRQVFASGEALNLKQVNTFNKLLYKTNDTTLNNLYGPTEATVDVSYFDCSTGEELEIIPIGKPIDNIGLYVMDKYNKLQPIGIPGELCISGVGLARGYLNKEGLTEEKFIQSPFVEGERLYRTGDLTRWLPDGNIEYLGRMDFQVKVRGFRIELGEIENRLLDVSEIKEAVVIAREDDDKNMSLCAYYVATKELTVIEIRESLKKNLPEYMIPSYFIRLEEMPLTANGKVNRKALPKPNHYINTGTEHITPRNENEERIAKIWSKVLKLDELSLSVVDSFFYLGGDSIKAISAINMTNKALETNIQLKDLYQNQTIEELAAFIEGNEAATLDNKLEKGLKLIEEAKQRIINEGNEDLLSDVEDFYPLSAIQQGMVFYSELKSGEPIYHDQFAYNVSITNFIMDNFIAAIKLVCKRHSVLRTTFDTISFDEPMQLVHKELMPEIELVDVVHMPVEEQEQTVRDYLEADLKNKFDFNGGKLWRMRLFKIDDTDYSILFSVQHAILDGWSVATFISELLDTYKLVEAGNEVVVSDLKNSYKEYVAYNMEEKANEETKKYWQELLSNFTRNKLPFNISNKKINNVIGSKISIKELSTELMEKLEAAAKAYKCSLKEICLCAHIYLLSITSMEKDIVTGVVTHDRPALEDADKILGCFLNTIPIRLDLSKHINKSYIVDRVKQHTINSKVNELFLADIASIVGDNSSSSGNPIFDTLFNYTDFHVFEGSRGSSMLRDYNEGIHIEPSEMTNTLLDVEVSKTLNKFAIQIKYSPNYFYDNDIETAHELYEEILEQFADMTKDTIDVEELITKESKDKILYIFNDTKKEYADKSLIHHRFEEQASKQPSHIAIRCGDKEITYGELNKKANRLARLLIEKGVQSGDNVALVTRRNLEMIVGMLGILKAGGAYVPIDPDYPNARRDYIAENSKVTAVVVEDDYDITFKNTIRIDDEKLKEYETENLNIEKDAKDLAYIIYTSGSTGRPKGVMIEHHSAVNLISWVNREFDVNESDVLLFITSMCFDLSVYDIFGTLSAGGKIVIAKKEQVQDPEQLKQLMVNERITFWDSVPSTMNHMVTAIEEGSVDYRQTDLRLVFMSGDWIPVKLPEKIKQYFPNTQVISLGGATEGTIWSIYYPIEPVGKYQTSIPYGKPLDNNYFYILDDERKMLPYGVAGDLYIGGVGVARGYANDEEKTRNAFVKDRFLGEENNGMMYKTGDLGRMLPDGNIEFLGRKDHQVKIRGYRVELGEIENQLLKCKAIKETVVVDRTDTDGNKYLCAYIVSDEIIENTVVKEHLSKDLPEYMIPAYFVQLAQLPLTSNGKLDRKNLPEPEVVNTGVDFQAASNKTEEKLVEIWQELLNLEKISIDDSFFELGGHSLKATSMISKIRKVFNVALPLIEVFDHPTIRGLSQKIKACKEEIFTDIVPIGEQPYYQTSAAQKRMYILNELEGSALTYNTPSAVLVEGELNRERLEQVFIEIVNRHEAFRTSFEVIDSVPVQKVHEEVDFKVGYIEASEDNRADILQDFIKPFDLSAAPLIRATLVKFEQKKYMLLMDMHHIIADGTSMAIITQEFETLYKGEKLPDLRIQYKHYASWQNKMMKAPLFREQKEYWMNTFADEIPVLNMPTDFQRPSEQSFEGDNLRFEIGKDLTKALNDLASQNGVTLYMILLAAYNIVLSKYTSQEDIIIGSPIAGRRHTDLENMVGVFVNTLPMRNKPDSAKLFKDFLEEVKENSLKAFENQDYQFEELVENLDIRRDLSRNPLFDVAFILQNTGIGDISVEGLDINLMDMDIGISKFDLTLDAIEAKDKIKITLEYCTKLFKQETIERFRGHFVKVLEIITSNPNIKLSEIEIITDREKETILFDFNDTKAEYPRDKLIHEMFEEQAAKNPKKTALIFEGNTMSYGELDAKANSLAWKLRDKGVKPDDIVGIMVERSFEMVIGIMGILKAGGAYLPIDPDYPKDRTSYILEDSGTGILLTQENFISRIDFSGEILCLEDEALYIHSTKIPEKICTSRNLAYVIYTSGSTGQPKGTMIEHHSAINRIHWMQRKYPIKKADVILQKTPFTFDVSVWELFWWAFEGASLCLLIPGGEKDPKAIVEAIDKNNITTMHFVPSMLNAYLEYLEANKEEIPRVESLRQVFASGEALNLKQVNTFNKLLYKTNDTTLNNLYGPTEATVDVSYFDCSTGEELEIIPIGKPIDNIGLYVMDKDNKLQPIGIPGELCISGVGLARGYLNKEELTKEKFIPSPFVEGERIYRTGDLTRWLPDGNIEYLGRMDFQVKVRGFRIELGEIEAQMLAHEMVKEVIVMLKKDSKGESFLCGYFVGAKELTVGELKEYLLRVLPEYMVPSYFVQLEKMPLTSNGKVNRKALPEPGNVNTGVEYAAPTNETEQKLADIWSEILGIDEIGIYDNFFDIGGHSLKATSLVSKIQKIFNVEVRLKEIFKNPTINALALYMKELEKNAFASIEPLKEQEYYMTSSAQKRMYILGELESDNLAYNEPIAVLLEGKLDREGLEKAFREIVKRHEAFRTSFEVVDSMAVQKIHRDVDFNVEYMESSEDQISDVIKEFIKPFNLHEAPLFRVLLAKVGYQKHMLLMDMHHIITDGASMAVIIQEFKALYEGEKLSNLHIQYKDYAYWQNTMMDTELMHKQKEYWMNTFADDIPVLNMPTDFPRPLRQSFEGSNVEFKIGEDLTRALKALASNNEATMYMVLLSAYNIILSKYTNQEDIVVGCPVAGRRHADLENMVGMFVNTLAIRNRLDSTKTFNDFLEKVKENALNAFENQDYQFEELVESLDIKRDLTRNSLFDVLFLIQNVEMGDTSIEGIETKPINIDLGISKFDLSLKAYEEKGDIRFTIEYCTKLFKQETIERFIGHFVKALEMITSNPDIKLSDIEIITEDEKKTILFDFNDTKAEYPNDKLIHEIFEEQAAKNPEKTALIFEGHIMSYGELNAKVNSLAWKLRDKGVKPDDVVGIMAEPSFEMLIGIMGILKAGGAYLPIDIEYPKDRTNYILEDSGTNILLTTSNLGDVVDFDKERIYLDDKNIYQGDSRNLEHINSPSDLAYIIYTSGTTGKPKGVMVEHRNLVRLLFNDKFQFDFSNNDVWTMFHSYCFDFSVWEMYGALLYGAKLLLISKSVARDTRKFRDLLKLQQVTVLNQTPSAFYNLISEELIYEDQGLNLKYVVFGGEALNPLKLKDWKEKYPETKLINMYGITETTVHVTFKEIGMKEIELGVSNIGKAIPTLTTYIMDENLKLQPIGVLGELCVGGDGVARGYLNREELTNEKFVDNPYNSGERLYRSGDLARLLSNGDMEYLGRIDHQVKVRGFRIELGEIENRLLDVPEIKEAVVLAREDDDKNMSLCAYYVATKELTVIEIRENIKKNLPEYMIPSYFVRLEEMPLTANGKVDRQALPKPNNYINTGTEYIAPTNKNEEKLLGIWKELLNIEKISTIDNFFELGGHSLRATSMAYKIRKVFNVEIPLIEVFNNPTIKELSSYIEASEESAFTSIAAIKEQPFYQTSMAQKKMYILSEMKGSNLTYNMPSALLLEGELDREKLEQAFVEIVNRHDVFRTYFEVIDSVPVQRVRAEVNFKVEYIEASEDNMWDALKAFITPFDLSEAPLIRVAVVRVADRKHVLLMDMHHIISDGTSMAVIIQEFKSLYSGRKLPDLRIQYKDYANWQNNLMEETLFQEQKEYWMNVFADEIPVLNLPTDFPRPSEQSSEGSTVEFKIEKDLIKSLTDMASEKDVTMFMILLSVYNIVLSKYTAQEDIIVGCPIAGRRHADLENLVGLFVNTLPMRNKPDSAKTFNEFLEEVKDNALEAFENQGYQFEDLIENLDIKRDLSRNALLDVAFVLQNVERGDISLEGIDVKPLDLDIGISKFDLSIYIIEAAEKLECTIEYCTKLFKRETMERFREHFIRVLEIITGNPNIKISEIEIITDHEKERIIKVFNDTAVEYNQDRNFVNAFEQQVIETPDSIAVECNDQQLSYKELNEQANKIANYLSVQGVEKENIVAVLLDRSIMMMESIIGIWKAGGAYIPLDVEYPTDRILSILQEADNPMIVTLSGFVSEAFEETYQGQIIKLDEYDSEIEGMDHNNLNLDIDSNGLAYIIFTSGSTGIPKGAMIEHLGMINHMDTEIDELEITRESIIAQNASHCFDISVWQFFAGLIVGAKVVIYSKEIILNPEGFVNKLVFDGISILEVVPSYLWVMLDYMEREKIELEAIKYILITGETVKPNIVAKFFELNSEAKVVNAYGPAEASDDVAQYTLEAASDTNNIPVGRPIRNIHIYIVDNNMKLCPIGIKGEICVSGIGVGRGYLNNPEKTKEVFLEDPFIDIKGVRMYKTGDIGRWLPDGNIEFEGRKDFQVKIRGFRIELGEIETRLLQYEFIKDAVVLAKEDMEGKKYLCVYYVGEGEIHSAELREYLRAELPDYMIPSYFVQLERMPLSSNGKIDRKALPELGDVNTGVEYVAPRTATEQKLSEIWTEILGIEKIGIHDNFFEIGGHSLKATALTSKIRDSFNTEVSLKDIFTSVTIEELAAYIEI